MGKDETKPKKSIRNKDDTKQKININCKYKQNVLMFEIQGSDIYIALSAEKGNWFTSIFKGEELISDPVLSTISPWLPCKSRDKKIIDKLVACGLDKEWVAQLSKDMIRIASQQKSELLKRNSDSNKRAEAFKKEYDDISKYLPQAEKILKKDKPLRFLIEAISLRHKGDKELVASLFLSYLGLLVNAVGHRYIIGPSGKGKSNVCDEVGKTLPISMYESLIGSSAKSKIYAFLDDPQVLDHKVIYYDDTKNDDAEFKRLIRVIKDLEPGEIKTYETVIDKKHVIIEIKGNCVVWESAVNLPEDEQDYSRALICKVDESEKHNKEIDQIARKLEGEDITYVIPEKYLICKAIFHTLIQQRIPGVVIQYWNRIDGVKGGRANKLFMGLIKGHALLNCFQRTLNKDGKVIATEEDFKIAKWIFSKFTPRKNLTRLETQILNYLSSKLENNIDDSDISAISNVFDLSYSHTSNILRSLESKSFVSYIINPNNYRQKLWYRFTDIDDDEIKLLDEESTEGREK